MNKVEPWQWNSSVEMSSVYRLQLHHTLPNIPVKCSVVVHPSALFVCVTVTLWGCQKVLRWQIICGAALPASACARTPSPQWKFSIRLRCVSIKVTMVTYTLEDRHWCFGSAVSDGGGRIPIRGLTFLGHSSNSVLSWGQESCALRLFPQGLEESYEQKGKAGGWWKWRRFRLIILVWCCLKRL